MQREILELIDNYFEQVVKAKEHIQDLPDRLLITPMPHLHTFDHRAGLCLGLERYLIGAVDSESPNKYTKINLALRRVYTMAQAKYLHFTGNKDYPVPAPQSFKSLGTKRNDGDKHKQCYHRHELDGSNMYTGTYGDARWEYIQCIRHAVADMIKELDE